MGGPDDRGRRLRRMFELPHLGRHGEAVEGIAALANMAVASGRVFLGIDFDDWAEEDAAAEARRIAREDGMEAALAFAERLWASYRDALAEADPDGRLRAVMADALARLERGE